MTITGLPLRTMPLKQLRKVRAGWVRQFARWGRADKAVQRAIDEIDAELERRRLVRDLMKR